MFAIRDLSVAIYSNGFSVWHYRAGDADLFDVGRHGYFNDASDMIRQGDMILVSSMSGGAQFYVTHSDQGRVVIAEMSATRVRVAEAA